MTAQQATLLGVVVTPGVVFFVLSLLWLLGWNAPERFLSRVTGLVYAAATAAVGWLVWLVAARGEPAVVVSLGDWFAVHDYQFPLVLLGDALSLPFLALTVVRVLQRRGISQEGRATADCFLGREAATERKA